MCLIRQISRERLQVHRSVRTGAALLISKTEWISIDHLFLALYPLRPYDDKTKIAGYD